MRMRAAVLRRAGLARPYAQSRPLCIEEVELPAPGAGEVLVQIKAASLCHSDLSVVNGDRVWPLPIVPGHEAAGVVAVVGAGVTELTPGDHVALIFLSQCGVCARCREGKPFLCERGTQANREGRLITGGPHLRLGGELLHHHMGLAAFAEYALVAARSLVKIPRELPFVEASLFGCAVMCGAGTALNSAGIRPGDSVAVVGLGGVGLSAVMGAVVAGATRIFAIDAGDDKFTLASELGATDCLEAADAVARLRQMLPGGVDHAIECTGTVDGFSAALEATRRGGTTSSTSLPHAGESFSFPLARLVAEARTLRGSYIGSCVPGRDIPAYAELFRQGRLPVDKLVTQRIALDDINAAFDALADARVVRQVICF